MGYKNSDTRIQETLQLIENWTGGGNSQYTQQIVKHLSEDQQIQGAITSISRAMSQGLYLFHNVTNKANRAKRRAIILLRCALNGTNVSNANSVVSSISDHLLDTAINNELALAKSKLEQNLKTQWAQLQNNTANFLKNHTIIVHGTKSSGVTNYYFFYNTDKDRYDLKPTSQNPYIDIVVKVNHIPVIDYPNIQNSITQLNGVDLDTNHLAVTTQLTGCSYVYQINNNKAQATHISPKSLKDGATLKLTLRNGGADFGNSNGGTTYVFGAGTSNTTTEYDRSTATATHVVATYNSGWEVHAQQVPQHATTPRTYTRIV